MHGYNGVTFIDPGTDERWHTWDDWGLYLEEKEIGTPEVQEHTVEVPGREGVLDLTDALDGYTHYYNRELDFTFRFRRPSSYKARFTAIQRVLHGKEMKIILDEDDDHYYYGRCRVEDLTMDSGEQIGEIEITADCEPYRTNTAEYEYTVDNSGSTEVTSANITPSKNSGVADPSNSVSYSFADSGDEPFRQYYGIDIYFTPTYETADFTVYLKDTDGNKDRIEIENNGSGDRVNVVITIEDGSVAVSGAGGYSVYDDNSGTEDTTAYSSLPTITPTRICKIYISGASSATIYGHSSCVSVTVAGTAKPVTPAIVADGACSLAVNGKNYDIDEGSNICSGLLIHEDDTVLCFYFDEYEVTEAEDKDVTTIHITYSGGCL